MRTLPKVLAYPAPKWLVSPVTRVSQADGRGEYGAILLPQPVQLGSGFDARHAEASRR
jgi:hypothetical protein